MQAYRVEVETEVEMFHHDRDTFEEVLGLAQHYTDEAKSGDMRAALYRWVAPDTTSPNGHYHWIETYGYLEGIA